MLVKLIRPLLENGLRCPTLISTMNLSTSNVLFQQSFSGTNSGASSKPTEKSPNLKNPNRKQKESDNQQEQSQQEGPADREAERKASNNQKKSKK